MHPGQRLLAYDRRVDGAQALMASLVGVSVDVCFMNQGTPVGVRFLIRSGLLSEAEMGHFQLS
jgi:hypothetical protein